MPGETKLGMMGPACRACVVCLCVCFPVCNVCFYSLSVDVLHSQSIYLSISLSSRFICWSTDFFPSQLPIHSLSSFVPLNTAFSILPHIATQQNGSASTASKNLSILWIQTLLTISFFSPLVLKAFVLSFPFDNHRHVSLSFVSQRYYFASLFFFPKTFLSVMHIHVRHVVWEQLTRYLNRKHESYMRRHMKATIHFSVWNRKQANMRSGFDWVSGGMCACTGCSLQGVTQSWLVFSWITKEEKLIEGGWPPCFSLRRITLPAHRHTHTRFSGFHTKL